MAMLFCFQVSVAQTMTDTLGEIKVKAKKDRKISNDDRINIFSPGQKVTIIDSLTLQQYQYQSMAQLLSQQAPVFVRSYGVNNLATLNFRGSSAAQSQVYWNGIPLQNASLGMADVSLLPVAMINRASIVYGGSSALWGSGNVGGALMVENDLPAFDTGRRVVHSISAVAGSFQQYQAGLRSAVSTERFALSVSTFGQTAQNDFPYMDAGEELRMRHARLRSGALMAQAGYKAGTKDVVKLTGWYQQYFREIPRALFEASSKKNQWDESVRLLAEWKHNGHKNAYHAKVAFLKDFMEYTDEVISLTSDNLTQQVYAEAGVKKQLTPHQQLLVFTPVHLSWIRRYGFEEVKYQNRVAVAAAYAADAFGNKLNIAINIRAESINQLDILLPGGNISYRLADWLTLRGNVQRSFRAPTLNELYYVPGGNTSLKPEQGWSEDAGYALTLGRASGVLLQHDASFYNRNIKDWILWFGGAIWTPHNIATVHSRGVETENHLSLRRGKWLFHAGLNSSYVLATTEVSYVLNDGSIGKQIPYTPRYQAQGNAGFTFRALHFNYNHTYTGYRFITADESQYIKPYTTGNVQLLYTILRNKSPLQVSLQWNNVWNERYAVVNGRPMPAANFLAGLKYTILQ